MIITLQKRSLSLIGFRYVVLLVVLQLVLTAVLFNLFLNHQHDISHHAGVAWGVMGGGLIITALLIAYLFSVVNYRAKALRLEADLATVNEGLRIEVAELAWAQDELKSLARFPSENPNPVIRLSNVGTVLYANPAALPLLAERGLEIGQTASKERIEWIQEALTTGSRREIEIDFRERVFSFEVAPVSGSGYVNVYGRDITAKRQAEQALSESETRLRSMILTAGAGLLLIDNEGNIESFNPAAGNSLDILPTKYWVKTSKSLSRSPTIEIMTLTLPTTIVQAKLK